MGPRNVTRYRESQSNAACLQIAALVEAMKRPEGFFAPFFRYAGPVVIDENFDELSSAL